MMAAYGDSICVFPVYIHDIIHHEHQNRTSTVSPIRQDGATAQTTTVPSLWHTPATHRLTHPYNILPAYFRIRYKPYKPSSPPYKPMANSRGKRGAQPGGTGRKMPAPANPRLPPPPMGKNQPTTSDTRTAAPATTHTQGQESQQSTQTAANTQEDNRNPLPQDTTSKGPGRPAKPQGSISQEVPLLSEPVQILQRQDRFGTMNPEARLHVESALHKNAPGPTLTSESFHTPTSTHQLHSLSNLKMPGAWQAHAKAASQNDDEDLDRPYRASLRSSVDPFNPKLKPSARNMEYSPHRTAAYRHSTVSSDSNSDDEDLLRGRTVRKALSSLKAPKFKEDSFFAYPNLTEHLPPPAIGDKRPRRSEAFETENPEPVQVPDGEENVITASNEEEFSKSVSEHPAQWFAFVLKNAQTLELIQKDVAEFEQAYKTLEEHYTLEVKKANDLQIMGEQARKLRNDAWDDLKNSQVKCNDLQLINMRLKGDLDKREQKNVRRSNKIAILQKQVQDLTEEKETLAAHVHEATETAKRAIASSHYYADPTSHSRHPPTSAVEDAETSEDEPPPPPTRETTYRRQRAAAELPAAPPGYSYNPVTNTFVPVFPYINRRDSIEQGTRMIRADPYRRRLDTFSGA